MYSVDHLVRADSEHHEYWRHPLVQDNADVCEQQMLDVKINGEWEIEKVVGERVISRYHLKNATDIDNVFRKLGE